MKGFYRILATFFSIGLALSMSACGNNNEDNSSKPTSDPQKDYDLFIYNLDHNIEESFEKMCEEYSSRTGVIVKCVTPDPDEDEEAQINSAMNSSNPPDIFSVKSMKELHKWQESGNILDFSNSTETNFKDIVNTIPESIRLSSNTVDSFGIPYTIEGYGYLVDPKMLSSIFGGDRYRAALNDLKVCTYDEFENLVHSVNLYIQSGSLYEFELNGQTYTPLNKRSGLSENLNAVFSFSAGNTVETGTYMINVALAAAFNSAAEASIANDEKINSLMGPLVRFAEALDLRSSSVSGKLDHISRGVDLVDKSSNSPNQAIKNFVGGKSLFLLAKNTDYNSISSFDSSVAKRLVFIPIKMPMMKQDITASKMTEKNFNISIPISVPMYFSINAKSEEKGQKRAQDFLVWLRTSELAQKYIIQEFSFIPYDIKESSAIDNPLSRGIIEYVSSQHILPAVYYGAPENWCDEVGNTIVEKFLSKSSWYIDDYENIAEYAISKWKELLK